MCFRRLRSTGTSRSTSSTIKDSGLKAIIALHDTTLGPAVGGCRMWPYATEAEAVTDVLRLAKGMTYKAAMARPAVRRRQDGDHRRSRGPTSREALFRALGRAIDTLGGRYYTGEDVGTGPADMDRAAEETRYVLGSTRSGGSGDPSPVTARGVWLGIRAAVRHQLQRDRSRRACAWRSRAWATSATTSRGCSPRTAPA